MLAAITFSYFEWNQHQANIKAINQTGSSQLSTSKITERTELKHQIRRILNNSLWKVGKQAENFDSKKSEIRMIEESTKKNLEKKTTSFSKLINLNSENYDKKLNIKVENDADGRTIAYINLTENTKIIGETPDKSTKISLPLENLKTKTSPRFFLLQNKMDQFGKNLNNIEKRWKYFEYALAYSQAWLTGKLKFSEKRSKTLFQLALATHEIDKFGSTDYKAIMEDLTKTQLSEIKIPSKINSKNIKNPLNGQKIQKISQNVKKSLYFLEKSENKLKETRKHIKKAAEFQPQKLFSKNLEKISALQENPLKPENEFVKICNDTISVYTFPRRKMNKSLEKIRETESFLKKSQIKFKKGLETINPSKQSNPVMKQLYKDFTKKGNPGGIAQQLDRGFNTVLDNINFLEKRILKIRKTLPTPTVYKEKFPNNFRKKLSGKLKENKQTVRKFLSKVHNQAERTFEKYKKNYYRSKNKIKSLHNRILKEIKKQTNRPNSNWSETYKNYPKPGEENKNKPKQKKIQKYVIFKNQGTIGGIKRILSGARKHLIRIKKLKENFETEREKLENFSIDKDLRDKLEEKTNFQIFPNFSREKNYEISPPQPLKTNPNISVYHEIDIDKVNFQRLDPLGLLYESAPPTPIYLWFIDTIISWGMWDVEIEIEEPLVEEIFDYPNQMIPRPITKNSNQYIHKALPYKKEFRKTDFEFKLLVLSLRKFSISC